ncbi:FecR family protein [Sphingosinicella terrae]|uniref:FecR family protein n=1 Tax=Sphingosinicella terrae TaxID=2172047 RepID=UPI0013B363D3|nr:FecR domain-containing protein [Sphingosinicella terrae]
MTARPSDPVEEQLARDAATWFARMRGPDAEAARPGFEAWLSADPAHRSAYARAAEIFAMGKLLSEPDAAPTAAAASRRAARRGPRPVLAAAALLALLAGGWLAVRLPWWNNLSEPVAGSAEGGAERLAVLTAPDGEPRHIRLADGSRLRLSPGSAVAVSLDASQRRLELRRGRALFDVFHERRPFVVEAGGGRIIARGTLFDASLTAGAVTVRLLEGAVDVVAADVATDRGSSAPKRLSAGQSMRFPPSPAASTAPAPAASGVREFDGIRLAELIAEANAAGRGPDLAVADPALAARRISGRFRIDDPERLAERLAILLDLELDRSAANRILLRLR